jgi:DNA-binding transcriptional regulator LsrR (DeoR family)
MNERTRLLIKVSTLYYIDGLNQQEIASRLGISRPQISRMLSSAKDEGIVNITIKNPYAAEQKYEQEIAEIFGLQDVIVVDSSEGEQIPILVYLARAGATILQTVLKDNDIVGVMASRAICEMAKEVEGASWYANANTKAFGEKMKSKYWMLNAPAVVASNIARDILIQEPDIKEVLTLGKKSDVAVIGIGQTTSEASIVRSGFFSQEDIKDVRERGGVASICTSFLDENGDTVDFPAMSRMIGLTAEELRKIPKVIGIANGLDKVQAITSTLRGKWVDVLITDMSTAKAVLDYHRLHPAK